MNHHWVRTRVTQEPLHRPDGQKVKILLGEREDGGVFYQVFHYDGPPEEIALENARLNLDRFLVADLSPKSIGQFDVEPNFYIPGMSPAKL